MGRQWLHAKREVAGLKKGQVTGKLVKEIMVAAKMGGADPNGNARLFAAVEKARRASVSRDVIERAIKKGAGIGAEKLTLEHIVFEGYAPNKVPVIVEVLTDNKNRTAPEIRVLFKRGQLGGPGSNKFLFDHVGLVEAHHADAAADIEAAAIEGGAQNVEPLTHSENDDIPADADRRPFHHRTDRSPRRLAMAGRKRLDRRHQRTRLPGENLSRVERRRSHPGRRIPPDPRRSRRRPSRLGRGEIASSPSRGTSEISGVILAQIS